MRRPDRESSCDSLAAGTSGRATRGRGIWQHGATHVERGSVRPVIKELYAKAGRVLFVDIACYATNHTFSEGPYKGQDLHITLEKPEWWLNEFDKCRSGGIQLAQSNIINKYSKGRYKERVQLVYERV